MNCTPCFDMVRSSVSPFLSINVTSLRSTTHVRLSSARWVCFQILLSSPTHRPTRRPCRIHFSSAGVSDLVIFNTSISFVWLVSLACSQRRAVVGSAKSGNYFIGESHSVTAWPVGAFRMRTSVPPHSKETSSITDFISQMPRPCSAPIFSGAVGSGTAPGSNPRP